MSTTTHPHPGPPGARARLSGVPVARAGQDGQPGGVVPDGFVFPGTENIDRAEVFAGPGYQAPRRRNDPWATASLVMSLFSFLPGVGIVALAMGVLALRRLSTSYDTGVSMAWAAIVLGTTTTAIWVWIWFLVAVLRALT